MAVVCLTCTHKRDYNRTLHRNFARTSLTCLCEEKHFVNTTYMITIYVAYFNKRKF